MIIEISEKGKKSLITMIGKALKAKKNPCDHFSESMQSGKQISF